jgi:hypothetical protein
MDNVFLASLGTLQLYLKKKIMKSQILSLHWLNNCEFIACGANGLLYIVFFGLGGTCSFGLGNNFSYNCM